jgi:hypothetical protein
MEHNGPMGDSGELTVAKKIHVIGSALGGLVGEELMSLADSVMQFEPTPFSTDANGLADESFGFDLNHFVDAATGRPATEVVGGPGHYELSPKPAESEDKALPTDMLRDLMTGKHDPTDLSVTIPVKKLMEVIVEMGNMQRKAQANGQLCMEKTRELVRTRSELEAGHSIISQVWDLVKVWEGPTTGPGAPSREAAAKLRKVLTPRPMAHETMDRGFLADMNDPESLVLRVPTTEELKLQQEG